MTIAPHVHVLERLAIAHAAPRCGANRKYDGLPLPRPGYGERAVSLSWWEEHWPEDARGRERARQAALRHGFYTAEAKAERRIARSALFGLRAALASVD